ncbi:hypothetical protein ACN47E_001876 [Coniothyrium glycines]
MRRSLIVSFTLLAPSWQAYVWPSKQDQLDDLLYLQSGYIRNGALSDQVLTCDFGANVPGIQKAAEWVRTAFHDAVTHDATTRIGGLDASIQYELDRPENLGAALNNTMADISSSVNIHSSAADVLALSLVMAVARCGRMRIPLRTGRIDATEAGIKGVPEAHTDLETSRNRFSTASLNETEMITLIACGHSIGGVHSVDHPEIVPGPVSAENKLSFDTTKAALDNNVVLEYLDNSTTNPLIRNTNDTLNSDKRIFAADDNATMKKLADADYFKSQCEAVFERILDLVPGDVTLSEPMVPADIRPYITSYALKANGSIEFAGRIRVRTTPITGRDSNSLTASIVPISRKATPIAEIAAKRATFRGGNSFGYLDEELTWFEFNQTLPAGVALEAFNIRVNNITYDNAGTGGFPVNPDILYQKAHSCVTFDAAANRGTLNVVAAVSKSLLSSNNVPQIRLVQKTKISGNFIPRLDQEVVEMTEAGKETADYVYYTVSRLVSRDGLDTSFDFEVGDSKVEFITTGELGGEKVCAPL